MTEKFVNLTPHVVNVGELVIPPSGQLARCAVRRIYAETHGGVSLYSTEYGSVDGIPPSEEGVMFIVSALVLGSSTRGDLVTPGELVRDSQGKVIGCKDFNIEQITK